MRCCGLCSRLLISVALTLVLIGLLTWPLLMFVLGLWAIYRIARGWLALRDGRPMPRVTQRRARAGQPPWRPSADCCSVSHAVAPRPAARPLAKQAVSR